MMDAYEVTDADLELTKQQGAQLHREDKTDLHGIRVQLAMHVASFTETKVFKSGNASLTFVGIRADTELAHFLLDSLRTFVLGELTEYLAANVVAKEHKRRHINGFVLGCCSRISQRLGELVEQSRKQQTSTGTALVVAKQGLIAEAMAGIRLGKSRRTSRSSNYDAYNAGRAAGDRASFGRPVGGNHQRAITG